MTENQGVYEFFNNEGMLCRVDTATKGKKTYGPDWVDICESTVSGKILKSKISKFQYRTHEGEAINNKPTGFVIKINGNIEAFLPFSLSSPGRYRKSDLNYNGETIAVMVDSFDPNSLSIIAKEIAITDQNLDINLANEALGLIGKAYENGKYIRGTIIAEQKKWANNESDKKRAGYLVTIDGIEAFLPAPLTYFNFTPIEHLIGTNVIAGVEEINIERMSIVLSMKSPYENIVRPKPIPKVDEQSKGIVTQVTPDGIYVLLPQNVTGMIPRHMHPNIDYNDLLRLTGSFINCTPFRIERWNEHNNDLCMLVNANLKGIINGN